MLFFFFSQQNTADTLLFIWTFFWNRPFVYFILYRHISPSLCVSHSPGWTKHYLHIIILTLHFNSQQNHSDFSSERACIWSCHKRHTSQIKYISAMKRKAKTRSAFWADKTLSSLKCQLESLNIAVSNRSYYTGSEEWGLLLNHDKWATLPSSPSALTVRKQRKKTTQNWKHFTSESWTITHNFSIYEMTEKTAVSDVHKNTQKWIK